MNLIADGPVPTDSLAAAMTTQYGPSLQPLLPSSTIQVLSTIGQYLPQSITSLWGYELPLYKAAPVSDFLVCVHKPTALYDAFQEGQPLYLLLDEPIYQQLLEFTISWREPTNKLGRLVSNIWLEYDYKALVVNNLRPNFFFGPKKQATVIDVVWAAKQIYTRLSSEELPKNTYRFLLDCLIALNGDGWISQIGRMLARSENSLRLFVQEIPRGGILPYLQKIGYAHTGNPVLISLLESCYRLADAVELDIDITDRVGDKIGIECYFNTTEQALVFLDYLVTMDLCVYEKYPLLRDHLLQVRSTENQPLRHSFSHFKLGFHPTEGLASKVYMGYVEQSMAAKIIRTKPIAL